MGTPSDKNRNQRAYNVTLAAVTGQVGCITLVVILVALFGGLWLDSKLQTAQPVFTIGLMIGSVPVTLLLMFWVVKTTTSRMLTPPKENEQTEEVDRAN